MIPKYSGLLNFAILLFLWLLSNIAVAQTDTGETLNQLVPDTIEKRYFLYDILDLNAESSIYRRPFNSRNLFTESERTFRAFKKRNSLDWLSFGQAKTEFASTGLGSYQHFNNLLRFKKNKISLKIESGLASQNTLLMTAPIYQVSFGTQLEYQLTDWLSAYLFGRYLTKPLNRPKDFFDPFLYSNPLFLQTEVGGGLRTNLKKVNADLKVFSIYREESNTFSPMNSVIRIKF